MKNKPIIILNGEPNSVFLEIFFKSLKNKNYKSPIILVSSYELIKFYMKKLKFSKKINVIELWLLFFKKYPRANPKIKQPNIFEIKVDKW